MPAYSFETNPSLKNWAKKTWKPWKLCSRGKKQHFGAFLDHFLEFLVTPSPTSSVLYPQKTLHTMSLWGQFNSYIQDILEKYSIMTFLGHFWGVLVLPSAALKICPILHTPNAFQAFNVRSNLKSWIHAIQELRLFVCLFVVVFVNFDDWEAWMEPWQEKQRFG